jgi:hypothetical protein
MVTALITVVAERWLECQEQDRREQRAREQEREDAGPAAWRIRDDPVVLQKELGFGIQTGVHWQTFWVPHRATPCLS